MTNGEKIQQIFPDAKVVRTNSILEIGIRPEGENWIIWCSKPWWDSEYKDYEKAKSGSWSDGYHEGFQTGTELGKAFSRPQGKWVLNKDENPECPFCHRSFTYWGNFCSNCGADMRGDKNETDN